MFYKIILCILSGTLLGISWNSFGFPICIFFGFVPLLIVSNDLIQNKENYTISKIFCYSYLTFIIWNLFVIHWLAFTQKAHKIYAIEALLCPLIANSLFMSIIFTFYHSINKYVIKKYNHNYFGLLFICLWITFEKIHLHWNLSFPWLNLGNVFGKYHKWVQWYEYTGVFGGSLWILSINVFILSQYKKYKINKQIDIKNIILLFIFITLPIFISQIIYQKFQENKNTIVETIILQPKLDPYNEKYLLSGTEIVKMLLELVDQSIKKNTNFIIAPETAFPGNSEININHIEKNIYIKLIKNHLKLYNKKLMFISGINAYSIKYKKNNKFIYNNIYQKHFNSAIQLSNHQPIQIYHKSKLVLGVEYIPFINQLNKIYKILFKKLLFHTNSLTIQNTRSVFKNKFNNIIVAPIICYESIYGEYVTNYIKKGANILFIMTNDSWWGNSEGHKQLLMMTKLRAIETRKNIVRSANSGISCTINSKGDINNSLNYLTRGTIYTKNFINNYKTIYVLYGDYIAYICISILIIIFIHIFFNYFLLKLKKIT